MLKEFYDIKKEIKTSKLKLCIIQCYLFVWNAEKNTESKNPKVVRTKKKRTMLMSKCSVCNRKKSKFHKGQNVRGLLSSFGIRTPLSKVLSIGPLLF